MTTYGVTDEGFVDKPEEIILAEIETSEKGDIDPGLDVSSVSPAGQLNAIFAAKVRELWEVAQALYSGLDPDAATSALLRALSALTGTLWRSATPTTVVCRLNLDAATTVTAGSVASVAGNPNARFVTLVDVTNSGGSPADFETTLEAETPGPVVANAGTLTVIETTTPGWNSIVNDADGVIGLADESDEELRIRREDELRQAASSAIDAIRVNLLLVDSVVDAVAFENTTGLEDADGIPAHAFEVVVYGGEDQDILDAIWARKPAGGQSYGNTSGTVLDVVNEEHTLYFTRPTEKDIYEIFELTVNTDPLAGSVYPADGDTQVKNAISAWAQVTLGIGDDLILSKQYAILLAIDGVLDVTAIKAGFSAAPTGTSNLAIDARGIGIIQVANLSVVTS